LPDTTRNNTPFLRKPKNIVLISVESLSASFMGAYGSTQGLTPRLDALAKEGLQFDHLFATGTRTVRGLEALSLSTPPAPGQAIVRRPDNDHLSTMGGMLAHQGYTSTYFYGGYGLFDNMQPYFSANDYQVLDRTSLPKDDTMVENIWGVADEYLFNHVVRTLDQQAATNKPFFAHVMTTSNHRPYTYPNGRIDIPSPGGRDGGVKYTDYAIGQFIQNAKTKAWFKDTLFVIVADHCAAVAGKSKLPVDRYHIPLIFYAPDLIKPSHYQPMMSQIDIAPTLMDILDMAGGEQFFGQSVFSPYPPLERAFISNYQELGYYKKGILTVLLPKQKVESYHVDATTLATTPAPIDTQLVNEAIAYYQTAAKAYKTGALKAPYYVKAP
jgi:phosphoglycerol transferase MdoB-like AlkP superfamily enzyme